MKVAIIGGHLAPALSVIEKLEKEDVYYIGRKHVFEGDKAVSFEYQEITRLGIKFFPISTARLQRKFTRYTFLSLSKLPIGLSQAILILRQIKPDVVLGFGGYVSIPVATAARFLKIPVVIHEQTLEAGFANKVIAKFAKKICISWPQSEKFFPKEKTVLTGNPVRAEIIKAKQNKKEANKIPLIYITGGSSGSHSINFLVENSLSELLKDYSIIHQTGDSHRYKDFDVLSDKKNKLEASLSKNYEIRKFLNSEESAEIMNKADLVVGRSGINTVTELIFLEKPAFLIPLPYSQKNEQLKNAEFIQSLGLSEVIKQDLLTENLFASTITGMIKNIESYKLKEEVLLKDNALKIVKVLEDVAKKKTA